MSECTHKQSENFIGDIRTATGQLLDAADIGLTHQSEWNNQFGGAAYLLEADFTGTSAGLVKADMSDGLAVLAALNAWLDEAEQNRRVNLQKLRP
jgi:hypothetical protein